MAIRTLTLVIIARILAIPLTSTEGTRQLHPQAYHEDRFEEFSNEIRSSAQLISEDRPQVLSGSELLKSLGDDKKAKVKHSQGGEFGIRGGNVGDVHEKNNSTWSKAEAGSGAQSGALASYTSSELGSTPPARTKRTSKEDGAVRVMRSEVFHDAGEYDHGRYNMSDREGLISSRRRLQQEGSEGDQNLTKHATIAPEDDNIEAVHVRNSGPNISSKHIESTLADGASLQDVPTLRTNSRSEDNASTPRFATNKHNSLKINGGYIKSIKHGNAGNFTTHSEIIHRHNNNSHVTTKAAKIQQDAGDSAHGNSVDAEDSSVLGYVHSVHEEHEVVPESRNESSLIATQRHHNPIFNSQEEVPAQAPRSHEHVHQTHKQPANETDVVETDTNDSIPLPFVPPPGAPPNTPFRPPPHNPPTNPPLPPPPQPKGVAEILTRQRDEFLTPPAPRFRPPMSDDERSLEEDLKSMLDLQAFNFKNNVSFPIDKFWRDNLDAKTLARLEANIQNQSSTDPKAATEAMLRAMGILPSPPPSAAPRPEPKGGLERKKDETEEHFRKRLAKREQVQAAKKLEHTKVADLLDSQSGNYTVEHAEFKAAKAAVIKALGFDGMDPPPKPPPSLVVPRVLADIGPTVVLVMGGALVLLGVTVMWGFRAWKLKKELALIEDAKYRWSIKRSNLTSSRIRETLDRYQTPPTSSAEHELRLETESSSRAVLGAQAYP